jgi:tripartite-type tricarboxylate transporter receptor subunit TctC
LAKSKPGALNYASSGPGTPYHMAGELFKAMSGTNIVHVPHRGSGEARNSVIGGHVQMMIDAITTMAPNAEAGQVRALAVTGKKRSDVLPNVPTVDEAGVAGYDATIWLGLMAPANTPKPIVDKLNAEMKRILALDLGERLAAIDLQSSSPDELGTHLRKEIDRWGPVIKKLGLKAQ